MSRPVAALFLAVLLSSFAMQAPGAEPVPSFSVEQAADSHPAQLYQHAGSLFQAGQKNEAGFWFYVGQLRYRVHIAARPDLPPDGDPALYASLNSVLGTEINGYLGGDPEEWEAAIERALDWDEQNPNGFTPKNEFPTVHAEVRAGLQELKTYISENHEEIRAQRAANGLENR